MRDIHTGKNQKRRGVKITSRNFDLCTHRVLILTYLELYLYTRVSTAMQIDGYSLEAQKTKMKAYCDYNEYEIAGEYEDAGKSGKSIEGRIAFNQMMDDIKSGKDRQGVLKVYLKESKKQKCKLIIS